MAEAPLNSADVQFKWIAAGRPGRHQSSELRPSRTSSVADRSFQNCDFGANESHQLLLTPLSHPT